MKTLRQRLPTLDAWVAAIRRDQTPDRAYARKVEWDAKFGLIKINPLCDWSSEMVWNYVRSSDLPYNPLHDRDYPSIGCESCTRPAQAGEDTRFGRWAGLTKTECGLHQRPEPPLLRMLPE
ncbi:MAG: phosphoadenosine phosphosulfate reductase family protein [Terriglobales bacterium]